MPEINLCLLLLNLQVFGFAIIASALPTPTGNGATTTTVAEVTTTTLSPDQNPGYNCVENCFYLPGVKHCVSKCEKAVGD